MAKEFDIYLNKRLTECDIIVYSIPYRDGLTVTNRMILNSCLNNYILQKMIAIQAGSCLVSHIDKMIKICCERLGIRMTLDSVVDFCMQKVLAPDLCGIEIHADEIEMLASSFISAKSSVNLCVSPILASVKKSLGAGWCEIDVAACLSDMTKRSNEAAKSMLIIEPGIHDFYVQKAFKGDSAIIIDSQLSNLLYHNFVNPVGISVECSAIVLGTQIKHPLGHAYSGIAFDICVEEGGTRSQKFSHASSGLYVSAYANASEQQFMDPETAMLSIDATADIIVKRHRLLGEMDGDMVLEYDSMSLNDVDYVVLDE